MALPISHVIQLKLLFSASLLLMLCFLQSSAAPANQATDEKLQATETNHLQHNHLLHVTSLLPATLCKPSTKGLNKRSSLKIVDKHGPCSQLAQAQPNIPSLAQTLVHDQSRVNSIQSRLSKNSRPRDDSRDSDATLPAKSGSSIGSGNYIVVVGVGNPARELSLIFDTGSDLTWIQCQPCLGHCYQQQEQIFDPSKSRSYFNVTCNSAECSDLSSGTGNSPKCSVSTCVYTIRYGDQSFSVGWFAKEKLTLTQSDVFDNYLFGCGQNNDGLFRGAAGLLGLGQNKISIVSQTAQKYNRFFSYCLPSSSGSTGDLTFGNSGVSGSVKFTPLSTNSGRGSSFYYLELVAITVGGRQLSISPSVFSTSGTIIDSGTVITRLPATAYAALRSEFRQQMSKYRMAPAFSLLDTCYDLSQMETVMVPKISLRFGGNVEVELDSSGILFGVKTSQMCLAFAGNTDDEDIAIIGNVQQRRLDVVYDVPGRRIGFGAGGCD